MRRIFTSAPPRGPGFALLFVVLGLVAGAALWAASGSAYAGTAVRMGLDDLARGSDLILEARVLSARGVQDPSGRIDTEYVLRVDRTLWGEDQPTRTLRIPGGTLPDGRGMVIAGVPRLSAGEDTLLFLSAAAPGGMRMPVGLGQGRFTVVRELGGRRSLVRAPGCLTLVDPATGEARRAQQGVRFDYAATLAEIEAALSVRRAEEAARRAAEARAKAIDEEAR